MKKGHTLWPRFEQNVSLLHHAFGCTVVVVGDAVFVFDHLTIEFVHQIVHGGVQVFMGAFGKQVIAFDMDVALGPLAFFFLFLLLDGQQHFHIHHLVKMSGDAIEFPRDVLAQGRGHFQMVSADD
jgi:hypothetical protein